MRPDDLYPHADVVAGLEKSETDILQAAVNTNAIEIEGTYTLKVPADSIAVDGDTLTTYRRIGGTGNGMKIILKHVISSTDGLRHIGFLDEYPWDVYKGYNRNPRWFMITTTAS